MLRTVGRKMMRWDSSGMLYENDRWEMKTSRQTMAHQKAMWINQCFSKFSKAKPLCWEPTGIIVSHITLILLSSVTAVISLHRDSLYGNFHAIPIF
jgi:hypothetical protein